MQVQQSPGGEQSSEGYPAEGYAWYVVGLLSFLYVLSLIDRMVLVLLIDPIRHDMQINDTEISLIHGIAFSLLYAAFGVPAGRFADRYNRRNLIAAGFFLWSLMGTLSGVVRTYIPLFLTRVGLGLGQTVLSPTATSLIADYFPPAKRGRAYGVYSMGSICGSGLAFMTGGAIVATFASSGHEFWFPLIGEVRGWQFVFLVTGLPGIFLTPLIFTIREPKRLGTMQGANHTVAQVPFIEVLKFIGTQWRTYLPLACGFISSAALVAVYLAWLPVAISRGFNLPAGSTGVYVGAMLITLTATGQITMGRLADALTARGSIDAPVRVTLGTMILALPFAGLAPIMPTLPLVWIMLVPFMFLFHAWLGLTSTILASIIPNQMRAQIMALLYAMSIIASQAVAPTIVAMLTDYVFADPTKVRYSLAIVASIVTLLSIVCFWILLPAYRASRQKAAAWEA